MIKIGKYNAQEIEEKTLKFWEKNKVYEKLKKKNSGKKKFYYLDGPPYTTGKVHIGHAWGKALRDSLMRYKRMQGFDVWDQPGFDMHGLPIEVSVEKKFGINDKKEIIEKFGLQKFIEMCQEFSLEQLYPMIDDFKRLGVWMNWDDPYMTIKNEYIEGAWWALKKAHENKYLYEGKKAMSWCPRCATALAKHELEYENVSDDSIFVKLPVKDRKDTYLIVWTTTPWTIPFNLAVMAHPGFDYTEASVEGETWILAKALAAGVIGSVANKKYKIKKEYKGKKLEGLRYTHPLDDTISYHKRIDKENKKAHRVVMSDKYIDLTAGTGLVHCAPGCGAEDFEVGKDNGLPAFNDIDEHGVFAKSMGELAGLTARKDDKKFIEAIDKRGVLIAQTQIDHEYAHCWRCKTGVIYKATDQWFLAIEKAKDNLVKQNKEVFWVPDWAGKKWFNSWLSNLQDWCISRQRFWGVPLPIWRCESCSSIRLVESYKELKKLTGKTLNNLHRPWIDKVTIKCEKCKGKAKRVEDVLDVWLDSGAAAWAPLGFPSKKELYKKLGDADFILEGKDQIRGWFNSLASLSMVSQNKIPFKAVYMHGFVNDSQGRKMSKSLKNIISPYEVINEYGADTFRLYSIGGAKAGLDLNYNTDDMKTKNRTLIILWNLQNLMFNLSSQLKINPNKIKNIKLKNAEKYILSKLNNAIKKTSKHFDEFKLNDVPWVTEELILELSRTYIQINREKISVGSDDEKKTVLHLIYKTLYTSLILLAPVAPFISEEIYQNFKYEFKLKENSVHMLSWPKHDQKQINDNLESQFEITKEIISAALSTREKAQLGIRWPVKEIIIVTKQDNIKKAVENQKDSILSQTNTKAVKVKKSMKPSKKHIMIEFKEGKMLLDTTRTKELDAEGYYRETTRRMQNLRKKAGLQKPDVIRGHIEAEKEVYEALNKFIDELKEKIGANSLKIAKTESKEEFDVHHTEKIKGKQIKIWFSKI